MTSLDPADIERAAPPGSMRYFARLYASAEQRDVLAALFIIEAEIRATVNSAHEVAHTRLQWWRAEIDRLINRNAQHPSTRILQATLPNADFSLLHEFLVAADMDLARMTYSTSKELSAYLERSGALLQLLDPAPQAIQAGALIRRAETLRDLVADARGGRIYWPLDELDAARVSVEDLRSGKSSDALRALLAAECARLQQQFDALPLSSRPITVLTRLHTKLLDRIARADHDVFTQRHELRPLEKVWIAWRAARNS